LRPYSYAFTAARDGQLLLLDRDCTLVAVEAHNKLVVSSDPSHTIANVVTTPLNGGLLPGVIFVAGAAGFASIGFALTNGESIFLSAAGAGTSVLFFDV